VYNGRDAGQVEIVLSGQLFELPARDRAPGFSSPPAQI
jgi:hypothetical protein